MSASQPPASSAAAEPSPPPPPPRSFFPAGAAYSLDLLKAYSELRQPAVSPPPVSADSSGSPPKPAVSPEDSKPGSCDSTDQLTEEPDRCSPPPPPAAKLTGCDVTTGGGGGGGTDPGIRRYRTAFRPDQIKRLETEFLKDNYVSRPKRNELATELGLAEGTIKVWFQNRRMKHKRQQMTAWPLDPRFADPALAALLLQAAVASGGYGPYGGAVPPPPPPPPPHQPPPVLSHLAGAYYGPLAAAKSRFSPYPTLPLRPQPSLASGFLLPPPPPPQTHQPPLLGTAARGSLSPPAASSAVTTSSTEPSTFFRPFKSDSPPPGER